MSALDGYTSIGLPGVGLGLLGGAIVRFIPRWGWVNGAFGVLVVVAAAGWGAWSSMTASGGGSGWMLIVIPLYLMYLGGGYAVGFVAGWLSAALIGLLWLDADKD